MQILITNDDGINSEGLVALRGALTPYGTVTVLAPERNWSISGHNKTFESPLRLRKIVLADGLPAYTTDGTPSDCVSLAALEAVGPRPDLVVSGINKGANMGEDITYSGTVAAAMEAVINGIASIAISLDARSNWDFQPAAKFAGQLVAQIQQRKLDPEILLNVNVPALSAGEIKGVSITRLGRRAYAGALIKRVDPFGRDYYWLGSEIPAGEAVPGTDIGAVAEGHISITPIHLDLTNHRLLEEVASWGLTFQ